MREGLLLLFSHHQFYETERKKGFCFVLSVLGCHLLSSHPDSEQTREKGQIFMFFFVGSHQVKNLHVIIDAGATGADSNSSLAHVSSLHQYNQCLHHFRHGWSKLWLRLDAKGDNICKSGEGFNRV